MFFKIDVLIIFGKFHRKTTVLESLFDKAVGLVDRHSFHKACNFIKMRLKHKRFPVKFTKFLKKLFLKNISDCCF